MVLLMLIEWEDLPPVGGTIPYWDPRLQKRGERDLKACIHMSIHCSLVLIMDVM